MGFFMTGWGSLATDGGEVNLIYVGLTVVRHAQKGDGIAKALFQRLIVDARKWQLALGEDVFYWFHTASPSFANRWWSLEIDTSPKADGSFTEEHLRLCLAIRSARNFDQYAMDAFPFVLRGCTRVRYGRAEKTRIDALRKNQPDSLLSKHRVEEGKGDRLIFVGKF